MFKTSWVRISGWTIRLKCAIATTICSNSHQTITVANKINLVHSINNKCRIFYNGTNADFFTPA